MHTFHDQKFQKTPDVKDKMTDRMAKGGEMVQEIGCFIMVVLILLYNVAFASDVEKETAAISAAEIWLAAVDAGEYSTSWQNAAELFRNAVKQDRWEQAMRAVREPLGKLISRKVKSKAYKTALPGAPDGEYVVIQFETSFESKKTAIETVTPMMDKDGKWRVSGYFIR